MEFFQKKRHTASPRIQTECPKKKKKRETAIIIMLLFVEEKNKVTLFWKRTKRKFKQPLEKKHKIKISHADPTAASALDTAGARQLLLSSSYACAEGCVASGIAPALILPPPFSRSRCPQSTKVTPPLAAPPFFFANSLSAALVASMVGEYLFLFCCFL